MDTTEVDWSMGSAAARLADWDTGLRLGRRIAGSGIAVPAVERARMREDFGELVPLAESMITEHTNMVVSGFRSRAWVMARGEWIRANLTGMQRLLESKLAELRGASANGEPVAAAIRAYDLPKVRALLDDAPPLLHAGDAREDVFDYPVDARLRDAARRVGHGRALVDHVAQRGGLDE